MENIQRKELEQGTLKGKNWNGEYSKKRTGMENIQRKELKWRIFKGKNGNGKY